MSGLFDTWPLRRRTVPCSPAGAPVYREYRHGGRHVYLWIDHDTYWPAPGYVERAVRLLDRAAMLRCIGLGGGSYRGPYGHTGAALWMIELPSADEDRVLAAMFALEARYPGPALEYCRETAAWLSDRLTSDPVVRRWRETADEFAADLDGYRIRDDEMAVGG